MKDKEYPLTIEILTNKPRGALLVKGQICKAKFRKSNLFSVLDPDDYGWPWFIGNEQARVLSGYIEPDRF